MHEKQAQISPDSIRKALQALFEAQSFITDNFINELTLMMRKFEIRTRTFQDLRKHLDKSGVDIESAVAFVKSGTSAAVTKKTNQAADRNNIEVLQKMGYKVAVSSTIGKGPILGQGLSISDLDALCKSHKFEADVDQVLDPILDTFEKDVYGEVPCNDFITQFRGLLTDVPGAARRPVVQASRYFSNANAIP